MGMMLLLLMLMMTLWFLLLNDGAARGGTRGGGVGLRARIPRLFPAQPTHQVEVVAAELSRVAARRLLQRLHLDLVSDLRDHKRRNGPKDFVVLDQHLDHIRCSCAFSMMRVRMRKGEGEVA